LRAIGVSDAEQLLQTGEETRPRGFELLLMFGFGLHIVVLLPAGVRLDLVALKLAHFHLRF